MKIMVFRPLIWAVDVYTEEAEEEEEMEKIVVWLICIYTASDVL